MMNTPQTSADETKRLVPLKHDASRTPAISVVIPVYNGAANIEAVVARVRETFHDQPFEVVLVDDGSRDDSRKVCQSIVESAGQFYVTFVELARNFGEHNAVLAGLNVARGDYVAVLDDDGQNPPEELPKMLAELKTRELDVVYGRYVSRKHSWGRRLGSWFNDRVANWMLKKPRGIYLSSFKVMSRFVVDELTRCRVPFPYIDGVICRTTTRIGEVDVAHGHRLSGHSNYTLTKLVALWLNMFLGFTIWPLRVSVFLGLATSLTSLLWLAAILLDKLYVNPNVTAGIPTVLACIVLFSGAQLCVLGMIGEYVGRIFLTGSGTPQFIVREATSSQDIEERRCPKSRVAKSAFASFDTEVTHGI